MTYVDREWYKAQSKVYFWLYNNLPVKRAGYCAPYDFYTPNGTHIEAKWSPFSVVNELVGGPQKAWKFSIQRHGELNESVVDFYVFRLDVTSELKPIGISRPIYLVVRSPIGTHTITITAKDLLTGRWAHCVDNWRAIEAFDKAKGDNLDTSTMLAPARPPLLKVTAPRGKKSAKR